MRPYVPDEVDRRLLDVLQANARLSAEQLGAAVDVSPSTAHRRVQRLRDSGVITAEVAVVDPKAVGRPVVIVMGLVLEREDVDALRQLRSWLAAETAVQLAWYVTGDVDFLLVLAVRDVPDYEAFSGRLLKANPVVRSFTTSVALSTVKRSLVVPTT